MRFEGLLIFSLRSQPAHCEYMKESFGVLYEESAEGPRMMSIGFIHAWWAAMGG